VRIVGCAFSGLPGPVTEGFIRIDDVTALLGPNDAGKSRLLDALVAALDGDIEPPASSVHELAPSAAIYAELDDAEFERVATRDLGSMSKEARTIVGFIGLPHRSVALEAESLEEVLTLSAEVQSALRASRLVAFSRGTDAYWRTWLCLPDVPEAPEDCKLLERIAGVPLRAFYDLGKKLAGSEFPVCLLHPSTPPLVVELAGVGDGALPEPVRVPTTSDAVVAELALAVDQLLGHVMWAKSAADELDFSGSDRWHAEEFHTAWTEIRDSHRAWALSPRKRRELWYEVVQDGRVLRRRRELDQLVARASRVASRSLPAFIAERYGIVVTIPVVGNWDETAPLDIQLQPRDGSPSFGLDATADGARLWVELALLEAIRDLRRWPAKVEASIEGLKWNVDSLLELSDEADRLEGELEAVDPEDAAYAEAEAARGVVLHELGQAREAVASFPNDLRSALRGALKLPRESRPARAVPSLDRPRSLRPPLYVLDEPERHLHPRLQRAAAQWLGALTETEGVQVALVTHSVHFIRLPRQAQVYVRRTGSESTVQNVAPEQLDAINEITRELGLDRGELLASVSLLLFVEGESDRIVLESLFSTRLRTAGIAVISMGGVTRSGGVLDAEMLLRWSSAQICVMFDDLAQAELDELVAMSDGELRKASRKGKTERQYMARLMAEARRLARPMHVQGIPVHDIFDLLDDPALHAVFPRWPGRARARAAQKREGEGVHPKDFREREYGIPKHEVFWYAQVADRMRDKPPRALDRVVRAAEQLALAARL
jgi:putative AbiEii toxin of type IV toxin-antitoxin system